MTTFRHRYFDGQVTSPAIAGEAVTEEKIADDAVTSAKIKDETITGADIGAGQVQTADIADGAVTLAKLGSDVSIVPLQDNAVTEPKLADSAVSSSKLRDASVTPEKLATHAVTSTKLNDGAVTSSKIGAGEVTPTKLAAIDTPADGEVPTYNQAQGKVEWKPFPTGLTRPITPPIESAEIGDAQVTTPKIGDLQITDSKIANGAITTPKIGDSQIANSKLQDASVTPPKVDAVNAPTDGQALTFEQASGRYKYASAGGSKITLINPQTVFDETNTTDRSAPLDVSTVVPATAIGVLIELHQDGQVPGWAQPSAQVQHPLGGVALTVYITGNSAGNMPMYADNAGIVPVYAPQQIYLVINRVGVSTRVKVTVTGYIE